MFDCEKVDWWESWMMRKLSDEKVDWWESLKGITNGRTNGRTLLTLELLRDWKEIYPEINLISNQEHHEAWSCLKCDVSHLYCNSNEHHQSSPINDWWCSWLLIWLICGYISIMDTDRQTDKQTMVGVKLLLKLKKGLLKDIIQFIFDKPPSHPIFEKLFFTSFD